jgi:hypothetical protein
MNSDNVLNSIIVVDDLASLFDIIQKLTKNEDLLSWFVTINKILGSSNVNVDLVYKIIERDKYKLYKYDICKDMDSYKIMNLIPLVINTIKYLKENALMFKEVELKVKTKV